MAYKDIIPAAADLLSQSQDDILNNFIAIKTLVDINHVTFDAADQGKHSFIEFPVQAPVPTTGAGEVGLYSQTSALTGNPELVFSHESAGSTYEFTAAVKAETGYAILPSGIIFKWGSGTVNANTTATATFAIGAGIPVFTTVYNMQVTRQGAAGSTGVLYYQSFTTADVTVFNTADAAKKFFYTAIGV